MNGSDLQPDHRTLHPFFSVVIPTVLRPRLRDALLSVQGQEGESPQIMLVVDARDDEKGRALLEELTADVGGIDVIFTGGGRGGAAARQLGVEAATGSWIAFLDDDDTWRPQKLSAVRAAIDTSPGVELVASQYLEMDSTGRPSEPVPRIVYRGGSVAEYLFRRRAPRPGRASMPTSTLVVRAESARITPWRPELSRHQDWDWIVRIQQQAPAGVLQLDMPLVEKTMGSVGSISASSDWAASLAWSREILPKDVRGEFVAGQVLRYALQARSPRGVHAAWREVARVRRMPSLASLALGLTGLLPRKRAESAFGLLARHGTRPEERDV